MIKLNNYQGNFEFDRVEDLKEFLKPYDVEDHDMQQFGYLISNVKDHNALSAFCSKGLKALSELRDRGMEVMVRELKK